MSKPTYKFRKNAAIAINARQSNMLTMTGSIHDLFYHQDKNKYVPLLEFIASRWCTQGQIVLAYGADGKFSILNEEPIISKIKDSWLIFKEGTKELRQSLHNILHESRRNEEVETRFEKAFRVAQRDPVLAIQFMSELCKASRMERGDNPLNGKKVITIIEAAHMLFPQGELAKLSPIDRQVIGRAQDWFLDPDFVNGTDPVIMLSESVSGINTEITKLPQILNIKIPAPDLAVRTHYTKWFNSNQPTEKKINLKMTQEMFAKNTAGLSIYALRQLLIKSCYTGEKITNEVLSEHIKGYVESQLGEGVVEFKQPTHKLNDLVGFKQLKKYLKESFIPRLKSTGDDAFPGAAVCGPIGSGKSFIFEAVASESDMVVLILKNIRSKFFGETDIIFEKLKALLESLGKVLIFVDEADTQFGKVSGDAHETEKRLTGKIQAMMSDPSLKGKVKWLLMTARINELSPDIRRPGRVGDLIIPIFDPEMGDSHEFIKWMVKRVISGNLTEEKRGKIWEQTKKFSAAAYASMRSELISVAKGSKMTVEEICEVIENQLPSDIEDAREIQKYHALLNCTKKSLLPMDFQKKTKEQLIEERKNWLKKIKELESS